jgi:hypothetical protein
MSASVYSAFVLSCVQGAALQRVNPPSKKFYQLCKKIKKLKRRPRHKQGAVEPYIDNDIIGSFSMCTILQPPVTSFLRANNLLEPIFLNSLNSRSSHTKHEHVLLYILILRVLGTQRPHIKR